MDLRKLWKLLPPAPDEYVHSSGLPPLIAQLLYNRGIKPEQIELFLVADQRLEGNPFLLPDMPQAVNRIYRALLSEEKIAIYGDFDVDGITATITLTEGLSWLGGKVIPYIPDRFDEGHGLKFNAIEKLRSQGVGLIITVDCGVTDPAEVKRAQKLGLDIIITDHHMPTATLPQTIAVIDAKRNDSRYPYPELAGVGVAFKLLQALLHQDHRGEKLEELLDLVALGTVADLVPLTGENRYLVKKGLKRLNSTSRPGLKEMFKLTKLEPGRLDTEAISWILGPRLNAAGRMEHANVSYQLLTTSSSEEACQLAATLEERNTERQRLTDEVLNKVREKVANSPLPLLMAGDESYPVGIIGLVAGRLVDQFYKPAIIINLDPEVCHGSCRSIPEFNIITALEKCHELLTTYGGHPLAAGFTIAPQNLAKLEERLISEATTKLAQVDLSPKLTIDTELSLSSLSSEVFNLVQQMEPLGRGNPRPVLLSRHCQVVEHRSFGNQGRHLELKLKQGNITWKAVDFNSPKAGEGIPSYVDIVYCLGKSWWNGEETLRLNLLGFAPSA